MVKGVPTCFAIVALVNQSRNDVTILNGKVVMRSINVGGNNAGKVATILFGVGTIQGINEALGVGISLIGRMRRTIVQHGFVNGIGRLVGKDAGGLERKRASGLCKCDSIP